MVQFLPRLNMAKVNFYLALQPTSPGKFARYVENTWPANDGMQTFNPLPLLPTY